MADTNTIPLQPEDFIQDGIQFTHEWNPRTVTDEGQGAWSIVPKETLVFNPERLAPRLFENSSVSTNNATAPAPAPAPALVLSNNTNNSGMMSSLNERPLIIDPRYDAPAPAALAAPTSVMGMFPEVDAMQRALYQQKQNEAMQAQAMQYARLDPMQQAQYSLYMGGQQLGGAIGGALGGKDPQLQQISMRNAIMRRLDPSDPAQQMKVAQEIAQYDPEFAMSIADNARKSAIQIKQASGAARQGIAAKVQEAEAYALKFGAIGTNEYNNAYKSYLQGTDKLPEKQSTGARVAELTRILSPETGGLLLRPSERAALEAELATYERPDKQLSLTSDRDAISAELYDNKPFAQITPAQKAIVNKRVEEEGNARAKASAILLPGQPAAPKDWLAFTSQISKDPVMERTSTVISDAPSAIETIRMSTTNDIAAASLPGALARLTGEGRNMSDRDIARYARTGGLTDRVAQDVVGFFTGQRTSVTKEQAERFATAVYRGALLERKKFIQDQAEQAGYKDTPNYAIAIRQLDDQLAKFKLIKPSEKAKESLPNPTVEFDTDKEKRYQEWKNKQGGAKKND